MLIHLLEDALRKQKQHNDSYLFLSVGENENPNIKASFYTLNNMLEKTAPKHLKWDSYLTPLADHQTNPIYSTSKAMVCWSEYLKSSKKRPSSE